MQKIPENVIKEWENKEGPIILTTVSREGIPNSIYATCVNLYDNEKVVVADNYFDKTKNNLIENNQASILVYTKDDKAYQLKGKIDYYKTGKIFDDMKSWNPEKHPGHGAATMTVSEIYSGSEKIL